MDSSAKEITTELLPFIRVYKDGHVERLLGSEIVPPSSEDPKTGVSSKDIIISPDSGLSARIYLPKPKLTHSDDHQRLPVLLYFHGGGFCIESAFSFFDYRYLNLLVSQANVLAVSVEYRLAPEHPLPAAYEDCWEALRWLLSHQYSNSWNSSEEWLLKHADFDRVFLGGDSAGANIAHNVAMKAGTNEENLGIRGVFLSQPYFWGSKPIGSEKARTESKPDLASRLWFFVSGFSSTDIDDPRINPFAPNAPSLAGLGCSRLLVCVAGGDSLKYRGKAYCDEIRKSGWKGEVELFEVEGEDHAFHVFNPDTDNAKLMIQRLASFLNQ